jgi:hypothetical protein
MMCFDGRPVSRIDRRTSGCACCDHFAGARRHARCRSRASRTRCRSSAARGTRVPAPLIGECCANVECRFHDTRMIRMHGLFHLGVVKARVWLRARRRLNRKGRTSGRSFDSALDVGFLGAYTTFSVFESETHALRLLRRCSTSRCSTPPKLVPVRTAIDAILTQQQPDGVRSDRFDFAGGAIALTGMAIIMSPAP